jgi:hypothetical protein
VVRCRLTTALNHRPCRPTDYTRGEVDTSTAVDAEWTIGRGYGGVDGAHGLCVDADRVEGAWGWGRHNSVGLCMGRSDQRCGPQRREPKSLCSNGQAAWENGSCDAYMLTGEGANLDANTCQCTSWLWRRWLGALRDDEARVSGWLGCVHASGGRCGLRACAR